jgi:hypothetical protein
MARCQRLRSFDAAIASRRVRWRRWIEMASAPLAAPHPSGSGGPSAPTLIATAPKLSKRQRAAARLITEDAPCRPVRLRAAIVGRARMPKAALEITAPDGSLIGHVGLANTSAAFDPARNWWLVGEPQPGDHVVLVAEGRTHLLLPGGRLRPGPVTEPVWSPLACYLLGWQGHDGQPEPSARRRALAARVRPRAPRPRRPRLPPSRRRRFRFAAVVLPLLFFAVCFPYLFVIESLVEAGVAGWCCWCCPWWVAARWPSGRRCAAAR